MRFQRRDSSLLKSFIKTTHNILLNKCSGKHVNLYMYESYLGETLGNRYYITSYRHMVYIYIPYVYIYIYPYWFLCVCMCICAHVYVHKMYIHTRFYAYMDVQGTRMHVYIKVCKDT